jgi:magnesium transporter
MDWNGANPPPAGVFWIDLINPTHEEESMVEKAAGVSIPSEEALSEIELSSRLVFDHGLLYLSSPAVKINQHGEAEITSVGFIVGPRFVITVRFSPLPTFDSVIKRVETDDSLQTGLSVFTALLEAIVDRGADVLERLAAEADQVSRSVFKSGLGPRKSPVRSTKKLRAALGSVGALADRLAKARDVLLGAGRLASFAGDVELEWMTKESKARLDAVSKDIASLSDYESRLSDKIQLVLDAVLGFISVEQNELFKVLTIVSVVGIPPTILVGIWGMNFKNMPELNWIWGYPMALLAVVASGLLPLAWFKARGWLE